MLVSSNVCALCWFMLLSCPSLYPYCLIPFINCSGFSPLLFFWPFFCQSITSVLLIHFCSLIFLFFIVSSLCKSHFFYPSEIFFSILSFHSVICLPLLLGLILPISLSCELCLSDPLALHSASTLYGLLHN